MIRFRWRGSAASVAEPPYGTRSFASPSASHTVSVAADLFSGWSFVYDPWVLASHKAITAPAIVAHHGPAAALASRRGLARGEWHLRAATLRAVAKKLVGRVNTLWVGWS